MTDDRGSTALYAAFSEYAAKRWGREEWSAFGRETGTSDLLNQHPRLFRSLNFGDDDYPDAVWSLVPQVLPAAAGSGGLADEMQVVADFAPDFLQWITSLSASVRTRKRFDDLLRWWPGPVPAEWQGVDIAGSVARPSQDLSGDTSDERRAVPTKTSVSGSAPSNKRPQEPNQTEDTDADPGKSLAYPSIFIVHGRDVAAVHEIQVFVQTITGVMPESLADIPGRGDTIIEKFERRASATTFAIVLLTPDDEGRATTEDVLRPRARQNVVLELGYFIAKVGRPNIAVINAGVERPSDIDGLSYIAYPNGNWKWSLQQELRAAGFLRA